MFEKEEEERGKMMRRRKREGKKNQCGLILVRAGAQLPISIQIRYLEMKVKLI
jgi:hypothetical protein